MKKHQFTTRGNGATFKASSKIRKIIKAAKNLSDLELTPKQIAERLKGYE